ncbi:hypothetical protein QOZ80_4AG0311930 [Eleusine coracana subsp. coracana]|nr:hypothetical protein QOZ80_4AG0311930 [Eleusine coracana subsp. coracana]
MKLRSLHLVPLLLLLASCGIIAPASGAGGSWKFLQNVGVSGMHMQLLHNDRVILFDRTNFGRSNLSFPAGTPCRANPKDLALPQGDCTAHAVEYNVRDNTFRPLVHIVTDTWCSSGYVTPDGTLVQTGGWNDGFRKVRLMPACTGTDASCDWSERLGDPNVLAADRWYATNQRLPDGTAIIVGGLGQATYEFHPKPSSFGPGTFALPFLGQTNTLYPFVHLNIDGNLFIFANNRAVLFNYRTGQTVRTYPTLGNGEPRTNPEAGSSVLLPLKPDPTEAEVLVCGGAPVGANADAQRGVFDPALTTCGRIKITDPAAAWAVETMPSPRVMGDMVTLPNGEVAILNGARDGVGGWEFAKTPADGPVIYRPGNAPGARFEAQNPAGSPRPRMYHSSALLLRDGRVLVGGSNPHQFYVFDGVQFPTELSVEAFSPDYLDAANDARRPKIAFPSSSSTGEQQARVKYGSTLTLLFGAHDLGTDVSVTMVAPSFTTHTFAQGQRLLFLQTQVDRPHGYLVSGKQKMPLPHGVFQATVQMPARPELAPPGYYMLFVVNGRIPSEGIWVHIS